MRWYISRKLSGADALPSLCNGGWKGHRIPPLASLIPVKVHFTSLYLLGCSDFGYGFHGIAWNSVFFSTAPSEAAKPCLFWNMSFCFIPRNPVQFFWTPPGVAGSDRVTRTYQQVELCHVWTYPNNLRVDQLIIISSLQFFVLRDRIPSLSEKPTSKINRSSAIFGTCP